MSLDHADRRSISSARIQVGGRVLDMALAGLIALITLGGLYVAYATFAPREFRATVDNVIVYKNFAEIEQSGNGAYRWSMGKSTLSVPQFGYARQAILGLEAFVPAERAPFPLTLVSNEQPWLTVPITGERGLHIMAPRVVERRGDVQVTLRSATWSTPTDPRQLGVSVKQMTWSTYGAITPPLRQIIVLPGFALLLYTLLRRLRFGAWPSGLAAIGTAGALAVFAAAAPLEAAPFTQWLLLMLLLAVVGLALWPLIARAGETPLALPASVNLDALLILFGVGYWLMLLMQQGLCIGASPNLCARPGTQWIGGMTLALLLGIAVLPRLTLYLRRRAAMSVLAASAIAEGSYATYLAFWRSGKIRSGPDFFILWRAAYDFHLGRPLYKVADVLANHFGHVFKVPPFYGMLFLPFATSDDMLILLAHRILNVSLYLLTAVLLIRLLRPYIGGARAALGITIIMGLMQPTFETIAYGQIDVMLLFLLTLTLLGLRGQRAWLTGLAITLAGLFKLYPFILLGFLVVRREWKALGWAALWFAIFNGIAIGVMGWQNHVIYVTQVLPNISGGTSWVENQTINGFLSRWLTGTMRTDPVRDPLINLLTYAFFALMAGCAFLLAAVPSPRTGSRYMLQFSLFTIVMVLAVPAAWMHYSTIIVLPLAALFWHVAERPLPLRRAVALALAFGLIAYGNQWSFFDGTLLPGLPMLGLSYKTYGLVALWSVMLMIIWPPHLLPRLADQWRPASGSSQPYA